MYGALPICKVLQLAASAYRRHAVRQRDPSQRSYRARRDDHLMAQRRIQPGVEPSVGSRQSAVGSRGDSYDTQSKMQSERRPDLTRAMTGGTALALTCRSDRDVPRALPSSAFVT